MGDINSSIFDFITVGIIVSDDEDKASDKSSNQKVMLPMTQDPKGVKKDHVAFSPMMHSPTSMSQISSGGALDPGSLVYFLKMPGENGGIILGQANDLVNYDQGASGGKSLLGDQFWQDIFDKERKIKVAPEIKETEEDGVKVKAIKEKDKKFKHSLLKGLPSHNANQSTTGYKLEQIKEVPTAKQDFDAIPTQDMMSQLPGGISSLGGMLQGLMGGAGGGAGGGGGGAGAGTGGGAGVTGSVSFLETANANTTITNVASGAGIGDNPGQTTAGGETPMDRLKKVLKPQIYNALVSIAILSQGTALGDAISFVTSGRVHVPTYLKNAEILLSQVTTLEDLFIVLHRLQHDITLFGHDELANTIILVDTAWGKANLHISINGDFELMYANANLQNTFVESMSSPASSPSSGGGGGGAGGGGGGGGGNMFGKMAKQMQDMFKRLPKENQKESKKMHEKLNQQNDAQKLWKFVEKTINGGNPLDPQNFQE